MPHFPIYLEQQRQPYNPFLKKIFDFYLFASYLMDSNLFPEDEKYRVLGILYAKGSLSIFAIQSCLQNGLVSEAAILLRSLFETLLNVKLILVSDTDNRLRLFEEFSIVEQWNNLQANQRLLNEGKTTKETFERTFKDIRIQEIQQKYDRVKSNYHPKKPYHWAWKVFAKSVNDKNPSIALIADKLGMNEDYVKVYSSLSLSVHNSPNLSHLIINENVISSTPNFTNMIYTIGSLAVNYMADIVELVCHHFNFGEPDEIPTYVSVLALSIYDEHKVQKS